MLSSRPHVASCPDERPAPSASSPGFVNVPKIKGTHNAMKSGMLAAESAFAALSSPAVEAGEGAADLSSYEQGVKGSWIWKELYEVRNARPSFHSVLGNFGGMAYTGVDTVLFKGRTPWTFRTKVDDYEVTKKASCVPPSSLAPRTPHADPRSLLPSPQRVQADRLPGAGRQAIL